MKQRILCTVALLTLLSLLLTGCDFGRERKREEAYCSDVTASIDAIGAAHTALSDAIGVFFDSVSEDARGGVTAALDGLDEAYAALDELTPPDKYGSTQELFRKGVTLALQGTAIYREQFAAVTDETVDDAFAARIQEGDELIRQAQEELRKGSAEMTVLAAE